MNKRTLVVLGVLLGGLVLAAPPAAEVLHTAVERFTGGLKIGKTGTSLLHSGSGSTGYDFPAVGSNVDTLTCAQTWGITVTGSQMGDNCMAGGDFDGGLPVTASMNCTVTTPGTVKATLCAKFTDGGTLNMPDAGIYVRTFR